MHPLGALPGVHLPTNRDGFINAVSPTQLPPTSKTNAICVVLTSVPPPPISSIPTSSVAAADLFHLEVHPLPSIYLLGNRCCRRRCRRCAAATALTLPALLPASAAAATAAVAAAVARCAATATAALPPPLPLPSLLRKQCPLWRQRRLATIATAVEGDGGGVSTAAAVGTAQADCSLGDSGGGSRGDMYLQLKFSAQ